MSTILTLALLLTVAEPRDTPPKAPLDTLPQTLSLDSIVHVESERTRAGLRLLQASVDSLRIAKKPAAEVWGPILVGLVAAASGFAAAAYSTKRSVDSARAGRLEEHLYDALKWFEGETQKRSVGLSVIEGNWAQESLHPTWRGVLVNQAVFLLSASKTDSEHERQNVRRILVLLRRLKPDEFDRAALATALEKRKQTGHGVKDVDVSEWEQLIAPKAGALTRDNAPSA